MTSPNITSTDSMRHVVIPVAAVLAVQRFAIAQAGTLLEMEINPLMVRPAGRGAVAADVVIRMTRERA